jgi:hypothetical protein
MKMTNAEVHDIPFTTLQAHITPNDNMRIKLGSGVGRKPILDDRREAIIVDVLIRKDRANEGASVGEAADILEQMCPSIPASSSTKPPGAPCGRNTVSA